MTAAGQPTSILQRKTAQGKERHQARSVTLAKAMRISVAKVARDDLDLALQAIGIVVEDVDHEGALAQLNEGSLMCLMQGAGGRMGAAQLDPGVVDGLIQQQTMGRVLPQNGAARLMTATDAAMCAGLLDALFERAAQTVEDDADRLLLRGFSFGAHVGEARLAALALEAPDYRVIRLTVDLAKGTRQGDVTLIVPALPEAAANVPTDGNVTDASSEASRAENLTDVVMHLEADLTIELCQIRVPLEDLGKLKAGDQIALPLGTFPNVRIKAQSGKCLGTGVLGQLNGLRALQLDHAPHHDLHPQRRADDAEGLELPVVDQSAEEGGASTPPMIEESPQAAPLPDMTSLDALPPAVEAPESDALSEPPALPDLPPLSDLPDLPDLDSLPDLADLDMLPDLKAG